MPFLGPLWLIFVAVVLHRVPVAAVDAGARRVVPNLVPRRQLANANSVGLITTYGTLPLGGDRLHACSPASSTALGSRSRTSRRTPESLACGWTRARSCSPRAWSVGRPDPPPPARRRGAAGPVAGLASTCWTASGSSARPARAAMTPGIVVAFAAAGAVLSLGPIVRRQTRSRADGRVGDPRRRRSASGWRSGMACAQLRRQDARPRARLRCVACWPRRRSFLVAGDAEHLASRRVVTVVARVFVRAHVGDRLHAAAGERDRRVPRPDVRLAHGLSRLGLFLSLADRSLRLAGVVRRPPLRHRRQRLDLSGTRLALVDGAASAWSLARGSHAAGLTPDRLARPQAATLVPKLKRPPAHRGVHRLRRRRGRGQGDADRSWPRTTSSRAATTCSSRGSPAGPSSANSCGDAPGPDDRQARRAGRGAAVRGDAARSTWRR